MREIIFPDTSGLIATEEGCINKFDSVQGLIKLVEDIKDNPDDYKHYEDNYLTGWCDACSKVLELLHQSKPTI